MSIWSLHERPIARAVERPITFPTYSLVNKCTHAGILERLGLEYVDLLLVHWPGASKVPLASEHNAVLRKETWRVLEDRLRRGQTRAIGVSNYQVSHLEELLSYCDFPPVCNQVECHPKYPQTALRRWCSEHNVAVVAYSSFGAGNLFNAPEVSQVAREMACSPAQALLKWGLQKGLCVLPKSVSPKRIREYDPRRLERLVMTEAHELLLDGLSSDGVTKYCWDSSNIL